MGSASHQIQKISETAFIYTYHTSNLVENNYTQHAITTLEEGHTSCILKGEDVHDKIILTNVCTCSCDILRQQQSCFLTRLITALYHQSSTPFHSNSPAPSKSNNVFSKDCTLCSFKSMQPICNTN